MKVLFTFFLIGLCLPVNNYFAQSVVKTNDFENDSLYELHAFPNDPQKMLGVQRVFGWSDYDISFLEINENTSTHIDFPMLTKITSLPVEFNNKIVFTGLSPTRGEELLVFDGLNTTLFDLVPGSNSSKPTIQKNGDRLFVVAKVGSKRQLIELNNDNSLEFLSNETSKDVYQFVSEQDDNIYYSLKNYDPITLYSADSIIDLVKLNENTSTRTDIFSLIGRDIFYPLVFNNNLYLDLRHTYPSGTGDVFRNTLIKVENDDSYEIMIQDSAINQGYFELLSFENRMIILPYGEKEIMSTLDGNVIDTIYTAGLYDNILDATAVGTECHFISDNGSNHTLISLKNGIFSTKYIFDFHGHFLTSKQNSSYYVTVPLHNDMSGEAYLLEFDQTNNSVDSFFITDMCVHPPYFFGDHHGALWQGNSINFIYGHMMDSASQDIYRFDTSLGMESLSLINEDFLVYPNPVDGDEIWISSEFGGQITVSTIDGKIIERKEIEKGKTELPISHLPSGTYIIAINGVTRKILIQ